MSYCRTGRHGQKGIKHAHLIENDPAGELPILESTDPSIESGTTLTELEDADQNWLVSNWVTVRSEASEEVADSIQKISDDAYRQKERLEDVSPAMNEVVGELEAIATDQNVEMDEALTAIRDNCEKLDELNPTQRGDHGPNLRKPLARQRSRPQSWTLSPTVRTTSSATLSRCVTSSNGSRPRKNTSSSSRSARPAVPAVENYLTTNGVRKRLTTRKARLTFIRTTSVSSSQIGSEWASLASVSLQARNCQRKILNPSDRY